MISRTSVETLRLVKLLCNSSNIRLVVDQDVDENRPLPNVDRDLLHRTKEDPQKAHQIQTLSNRRIGVDSGLIVHGYVARIEVGLDLAEARGPRISKGNVGLAVDVEMLVPWMLPWHDRMSLVREVGLDGVRCDVKLDRRLNTCKPPNIKTCSATLRC